MGFEHVGEAETLSADVTGVWFLASVSAAVPFHIGPAREALSTDLTDIWFLSWNRQKDVLSHRQFKTGHGLHEKLVM